MIELLEKVKEFNEYMQANGRNGLLEIVKAHLEENPAVSAVRWDQYAPYFNDGEPCVFSVYEPRYRFSPETEADDDDDKFFYPWAKEIAREIQGRKEFYQALSLLEDVLMLICEDGEITYTRGADDLVIGECSHD